MKQVFAALGIMRFTQRLFSEDGREIQDDEVFGANPMKLGILMDCHWIRCHSILKMDRYGQMISASRDDVIRLNNLLQNPAPNVTGKEGFTPLHLCANCATLDVLSQFGYSAIAQNAYRTLNDTVASVASVASCNFERF